MAEYIEREAVMQKFADHVKRSNNSDFAPVPTWNQAVQIVEDFPAADVRPVVLCKNCKYFYKDADGYTMCDNSEGYDHVTEDDFCSRGADMRGEQT